MEEVAGFVSLYSLFDPAENKFKNEAMFLMGKCLWPSIKSIRLSKLNDDSGENGLSCEGVKMLMLADSHQIK